MKRLLRIVRIASLSIAAWLPSVQAATIETHDFSGLGLAIDDGNPSGLANTQAITSAITDIQSLTATLSISGTFNGDLYAYLVHGSGFAVLLNRSGSTAANSFGYDDDGFDVTFDDLAPVDIHDYQDSTTPAAATPLTGTWRPDGRETDPDLVLDTDPSTATLGSFVTGDANGDWTLFVADLSGGEAHTLEAWSLTITGIPEPGGIALLGLGLAGLALRRHR
jgi:subtilisin-like proprotein convertase family protein